MTGRPVRRVLALLAGLVAFIAGPGQALAHGYAHHELHEHASHHATASGSGTALAADQVEVEAGRDAADHPHFDLPGCVLGRFASALAGMPSPPPVFDLGTESEGATPFAQPDDRPPPGFRSGPRNPRAPPSLT